MTCYDYLKKRAAGREQRRAVEDESLSLTYSGLFKAAENLAGHFLKLGVRHGDSVVMLMHTSAAAVICFYALNSIGAAAEILHPVSAPDEIADSLNRTGCKGVVLSGDISLPDGAFPGDRFIIDLDRDGDLYFSSSDGLKPRKAGNADILLHSGGTSGEAKTVVLGSESLNCIAEGLSFLPSPEEGEYTLAALPIFHAFGLAVSVHYCLCAGYTVRAVRHFEAEDCLELIEKTRVTFLAGVPDFYRKLLDCTSFEDGKLKNLRLLFCGGDYVSEALLERVNGALKKSGGGGRMFSGYGLTEAASVCCLNSPLGERAGSVGRPLKGVEVDILGENGEKMPAGQCGEIAVSGPTLMKGYLDSPGLSSDSDKKTLLTGDIGYTDNDGFLYFTDRKKRVSVISGYNIYLSDIEKAAVIPGLVDEACAVEKTDAEGKPYIALFAVVGGSADDAVRLIENRLKNALPAYSLPRRIIPVEALPRTAMGKVDYKRL